MRRLFAWCVFETYRRVSDEFFTATRSAGATATTFRRFLQQCGFHLMDITPCADGRLAHAISYVLRLPYGAVRRKSYAGSLFDIENTVEKWVETELMRFREGVPNTADAPTRYLKVGGLSLQLGRSGAPGLRRPRLRRRGRGARGLGAPGGVPPGDRERLLLRRLGGSAADRHGHRHRRHPRACAGRRRLTATSNHWLDAAKVYEITRGLSAAEGRARIAELVRAHAPGNAAEGAQEPTSRARRAWCDLIAR
jgi:hypothetical protein